MQQSDSAHVSAYLLVKPIHELCIHFVEIGQTRRHRRTVRRERWKYAFYLTYNGGVRINPNYHAIAAKFKCDILGKSAFTRKNCFAPNKRRFQLSTCHLANEMHEQFANENSTEA